MNLRFRLQISMLGAQASYLLRLRLFQLTLVASTLACAAVPVFAVEHEGRHHDSSGRQIAIVVPGMPHVMPAPVAVPVQQYAGGQRWVPTRSSHSHRSAHHGKSLSSVSTPAELSPEIKQAIAKGTVVAQGFSKIAVKRAADVGAWVATMWRQLNDVPQISPSTEFTTPCPPVSDMRPIPDAGRERQLYFTSERRLKTVVGQ